MPLVFQPDFYTVGEVAQRLHIQKPTVFSWIANGHLRAINIAVNPAVSRASWRVPKEAVDELIAVRMKQPVAAKPRRSRTSSTATAKFYS